MDKPLVNKVAQSSLINFNLEDLFPTSTIIELDIKDYLFKGLILREKDFREAMASYEWSSLEGKVLVVHCSADAIIPTWAYMLVASLSSSHSQLTYMGTKEEYIKSHYDQIINQLDPSKFVDQRVVIKGCSNKPVPDSAYLTLTYFLNPLVKSLMYGEPCSTVPIYKKKK